MALPILDRFRGLGCLWPPRKHDHLARSVRGQSFRGSLRSSSRRGITLIEMLVSVALTLLVVLAVVRVFSLLGNNVTESRSILELSGQLRNATTLLQNDLDRVTARMLPPLDPGSAEGYFELIEGFRSDRDNDGDGLVNVLLDRDPDPFVVKVPSNLNNGDPQKVPPIQVVNGPFLTKVFGLLGDTDDVLMATIRSDGESFSGRLGNRLIESQMAEVIWWIEPVPPPPGVPPTGAVSLALHRRVLLIRPDLNPLPISGLTPDSLIAFLRNNDISVRPEVDRLIANSLEDLTNRENRFAHWPDNVYPQPGDFPFLVNPNYLVTASDGRDLIISDVLAFDVRVFDRSAPLFRPTAATPYAVSPIDPGYYTLTKNSVPAGQGAHVDLGYGTVASHFSRAPHPSSRIWSPFNIRWNAATDPATIPAPRVYCTWSNKYERDGLNQDVSNDRIPTLIDEGTNGIDDDVDGMPGFGRVDDIMEQETSAPYPIPLRGIEVVLRVQEFSTQQVRQASVVGDFLPE